MVFGLEAEIQLRRGSLIAKTAMFEAMVGSGTPRWV